MLKKRVRGGQKKRQLQLIFQQPPCIFIFQFCSVYWLYKFHQQCYSFLCAWLWIKISYTTYTLKYSHFFTFFWIKIQQRRKVKKECFEAKIHSALEPPRLYIHISKWFFWVPYIFFFLFPYCRCSSLTLIMMHCNYHKVLNLEAYKWSSFTIILFIIKKRKQYFLHF